jgi:hypothetical protein
MSSALAADMLSLRGAGTAELLVRLTARVLVIMFAAALILFAAGYQHHRRRLFVGTRLFAGFIVAHTIHFATVAWLAVVTSGENIRERDGWAVVVTVAILFYMAQPPLLFETAVVEIDAVSGGVVSIART